jgi:hypothetical protein
MDYPYDTDTLLYCRFQFADGSWDNYTTFDTCEGEQYAEKNRLRLFIDVYQWNESRLEADFTGVVRVKELQTIRRHTDTDCDTLSVCELIAEHSGAAQKVCAWIDELLATGFYLDDSTPDLVGYQTIDHAELARQYTTWVAWERGLVVSPLVGG